MNNIRDMEKWLYVAIIALAISVSLPAVAEGGTVPS